MVRDTMQKYHMTKKGDRVVIGLSGGADSVCLFRVLIMLRKEMGLSLEAVHVNHGLRDTALR
ncbi:MAG: tRNA(Ile)-lysidine synthetase, partial [Lachnospiraceae bacterium]|nr:tRNA(Ile)-lysidine synthetase [Lachnospiraceae bacterium]